MLLILVIDICRGCTKRLRSFDIRHNGVTVRWRPLICGLNRSTDSSAIMIIFPDLTPSKRPSSRKSYSQQQPQLAALIALEMLHITTELQKEAVAWISVK